jgi:GT2 family glycosyltransferase
VTEVCVVVVNYNGADDLEDCVAAFAAQDHPLELVIVDNASADTSAAILDRLEAEGRARVVRNATNRGYAGGANDGLATTTAEVIAVANPDTRPAPDCVRRAVAALLADPRRGAVQPKLIRTVASPDGHPVIDTTGHLAFRTRLFRNRGEGEVDHGQHDLPGVVFGVSGALAVYRRAMLDDVAIVVDGRREVWSEDLFAFWEDVDLDWRAAMRGWVTWYEPSAVALHERGGAGPRRTSRVEALNWRNRLLMLVRCDDPGSLLRVSPSVLATTVLKTAELAVSDPRALLAGVGGLIRLLRPALAARHAIHGRATVTSRAVIARWFTPFAYRPWIRTWWRRVRRVAPGS